METIGQRIKRLRTAAKLTQKELADKYGFTEGAISNWENDKHAPEATNLVSLVRAFKRSPEYILTGADRKMSAEEMEAYLGSDKSSKLRLQFERLSEPNALMIAKLMAALLEAQDHNTPPEPDL